MSKGRFKVLFDEYGDIVRLEFDGEVYEGHGHVVSIPFVKVADVKLEEIPEDVYIEPVERIKDNVIYPIRYSEILAFEVHYGPDEAFVELMERRKFWASYIGLDAYAEALEKVLKELESRRLIAGFHADWDGDYFTCQFSVPLSPCLTLEEAVAAMRKFLELLSLAVKRALVDILAPLVEELETYPSLDDLEEEMVKALSSPLSEQ